MPELHYHLSQSSWFAELWSYFYFLFIYCWLLLLTPIQSKTVNILMRSL